jgi:hypothetical protein
MTTGTQVLRIELPFATHSQNTYQRMHFQQQRKLKMTCAMYVRAAMAKAGIFGTARPTTRRRLVIERHSSGRLDRGNLIGGCKPLLDALRDEGAIRDDSEDWLDDSYVQVKAGRGYARTVIEVSELA